MQGQKSSIESFTEAFEIDQGSSSSNSVTDQQSYWNNMLLNPPEAQNVSNYLLPQNDTNVSYRNMATQDTGGLSIWQSGEASSSGHPLNHGSHDGTKREHLWSSSLAINGGVGSRVEERQFEAASTLSLERVHINLNSNHVVDGPPFAQNSRLSTASQSSNQNAERACMISPVSETELRPHTYPGLLQSTHFPSSSSSSNHCGSSSHCVGFISENGDGRPGASTDGRRSSCKRKNIEGVSGQASTSGNSDFLHQSDNGSLRCVSASQNINGAITISGSSGDMPGSNPSEEQLTESFGNITRGAIPDNYPALTIARNAESSHRNFRMRINPTHQHDIPPPSIWPNNSRRSSGMSFHQQPSLPVPYNQSLDSRPLFPGNAQVQHQPPVVHHLPPNVHSAPWSGASSSRAGSLMGAGISRERLTPSREERNLSIPTNNMSEHSMGVSPADIRQVVQDPTHWSLANTSSSMPGNVVPVSRPGTNLGSDPSPRPTWLSHHNPPVQQRVSGLSEVVRRSLFASAGSEPGGPSGNANIQPSGRSATSQEISYRSGASFRASHQSLFRSAFLIDRQNDGVVGVPMSVQNLAALREGRHRMISEIRNALDLVRRRENLRFEDVFILDHSVFYGGADLHDRHRDMRLDVDNMSYEELLALEERIGNVSTGLSEEKIMKSLKQQVYSQPTITMEASGDVEPCCICQEDYAVGEDLGTLDCGHDFHTNCIKQWLMHKNLCPICKTTGLGT